MYWSAMDANVREPYVLTISQSQRPLQLQSPVLAPSQKLGILAESLKNPQRRSVDGEEGHASRHFMARSSESSLRSAYERAVVPERGLVTGSLLPTSPGGRIIPTTCISRNTATTSAAAFDPHPNNPVGLPLIRFMYS